MIKRRDLRIVILFIRNPLPFNPSGKYLSRRKTLEDGSLLSVIKRLIIKKKSPRAIFTKVAKFPL